jgi:hypothetical protein
MSDQRDKKDDPAEELKQGLSHLWRAARGVATEVKKEVERTDFGKALDGAGREFVRAAANVVDRIADEVNDITKPRKPGEKREGAPPPADADEAAPVSGTPADADDEFDGVKPKPKEGGPTPQDPGFRIAVDEDPKKKSN